MRTAVFIPLRLQRNAAKRITPVLAIHPAPFTQFTHGLFIGKLMTIGVLKQLLNIQMKFTIIRFFTLCWDFSFFFLGLWYGMVKLEVLRKQVDRLRFSLFLTFYNWTIRQVLRSRLSKFKFTILLKPV